MFPLLNKKQIIFLVLFILTTIPFFLELTANEPGKVNEKELYKEELTSLRSLENLTKYTDSVCYSLNRSAKLDTVLFIENLSTITKMRFKHGLSNYSLSDNWIANFSGKLFWSHFSGIVDPNDILKKEVGLCSQQSIVFLEILKNKGIIARSVGLGKKEGPGHFLSEVKFNGEWHLYDVSLEPDWSKISNHHQSMDYYLQHKDTLFEVYKDQMSAELFNKLTTTVYYGEIGKFPAKNMLLFHKITYAITILLPCVLLVLFVYSVYKNRRSKSINS